MSFYRFYRLLSQRQQSPSDGRKDQELKDCVAVLSDFRVTFCACCGWDGLWAKRDIWRGFVGFEAGHRFLSLFVGFVAHA